MGRWPWHLPVGSVRFGRSSANYDETVRFYRDLVGLPTLESFQGSYGEDGTIFGLPGHAFHLEIVRSREPIDPVPRVDTLVLYLPDEKARDHAAARLEKAGIHPAPPHPYWQANGGVEFEDPDGRKVVFVSWVYGSE